MTDDPNPSPPEPSGGDSSEDDGWTRLEAAEKRALEAEAKAEAALQRLEALEQKSQEPPPPTRRKAPLFKQRSG